MGQESGEKEPITYYCRKCRTWLEDDKCPACGNPGVVYKLPQGVPGLLTGVWDPEDGELHIVNADDMRYVITMLEELIRKSDAMLGRIVRMKEEIHHDNP